MKVSIALLGAVLSIGLVGCAAESPSPAPVTVTKSNTVTVAAPTQAQAPSIAAPVVASPAEAPVSAGITIPDIAAGTNAAIAQSKLESLGLTNVELASANPDYSNVFLPKNWTLVSIEPAPGSVVQAGDVVIVKVTKP